MAAAAWIVGLALAGLAGRLILWTTLRGSSPRASTLEAVPGVHGAIEYHVAPLDLACRGHVVVHHDDSCAPWAGLRLRGLEPTEVVALLRAEGFRADLVPGGGRFGPALPSWWPRLPVHGMRALRKRMRPRRATSMAHELPRP